MSGRKRRKVHCKQLNFKTKFRSKTTNWTKKLSLSGSQGSHLRSKVDTCEYESDNSLGNQIVFDDPEARDKHEDSYAKRKVSSKHSWKDLQSELLNCYAEESYLPEESSCRNCETEKATIRCQDCGPRQFLCRPCALALHKDRNVFHSLEVFEDGIFLPLFINNHPLRVHGHCCNTMDDIKQIICFDQRGIQHLKHVAFCQCEKPAVTLLRLQLWPGSSEKPTCAFDLRLMDLFERLFIHCKVSLKELTEVFQLFLPTFHPNLLPSFYAVMNSGCFDEYRFFKYQSTHLVKKFPQLYNGASCPLCPKEEGVLVQCMDACFGLYRKRSQGTQLTDPNHSDLYFADQDDVDNFVNQYHEDCQGIEQECNRFHAGEVLPALRSKGKNKLFDEKGVFGSVCRHDFPVSFHSIKHGEKYNMQIIN